MLVMLLVAFTIARPPDVYSLTCGRTDLISEREPLEKVAECGVSLEAPFIRL